MAEVYTSRFCVMCPFIARCTAHRASSQIVPAHDSHTGWVYKIDMCQRPTSSVTTQPALLSPMVINRVFTHVCSPYYVCAHRSGAASLNGLALRISMPYVYRSDTFHIEGPTNEHTVYVVFEHTAANMN